MVIAERDILFCSDFMRKPIPKGDAWMWKYFKTKTKRLFLKYFLIFGCSHRFRQHCGVPCTKRYIKKMQMQFRKIRETRDRAKAEFDLDTLEMVEKGRMRLS